MNLRQSLLSFPVLRWLLMLCLFMSCTASANGLLASGKHEFLPVEQAFQTTASTQADGIVLHFDIAPEHYLYARQFRLSWPKGLNDLPALPAFAAGETLNVALIVPSPAADVGWSHTLLAGVEALKDVYGDGLKITLLENLGRDMAGLTPPDLRRARRGLYGGKVVLTRGKNVLKGTALALDLNTGRSRLTAEPGAGGRVQGLFIPKKREKALEDCQKERMD